MWGASNIFVFYFTFNSYLCPMQTILFSSVLFSTNFAVRSLSPRETIHVYLGIKSSWDFQYCGRMKGRVKWDEDNLREIEANKQVRKEITEPKTPYPRTGEDGSLSPSLDPSNYCHYDYEAHAEALREAIHRANLYGQQITFFDGCTSSEDQAGTIEKNEGYVKKMDEKEFKKKRRAHYDEIKKIKELQKKGWNIVCDVVIYEGSPTQDPGVSEICINDCDEIVRTIDIGEMEENLPKSKVD